MPRAAIYDVISDAKTSLKIGGDIDADFTIGLSSTVDVGVRSVLSFMLDAQSPSSLKFSINIINGSGVDTGIGTFTINSDIARVFQEVVGSNVLTATGNKLRIKVLSGGGTLVISDIVLLYQKNV